MAAYRLNRRTFIKKSTAGALGVGILGNESFPRLNQTEDFPHIKDYRRMGRTGAMVSDIGSGMLNYFRTSGTVWDFLIAVSAAIAVRIVALIICR